EARGQESMSHRSPPRARERSPGAARSYGDLDGPSSPTSRKRAGFPQQGALMDSSTNDRGSVLSRYFAEIREYPLLTKEEEMSLAIDVKAGKREALNELVE